MPKPVRELRGIWLTNSATVEVRATIFEAKRDIGCDSFSCLIFCPALFKNAKRIFGVDADQALELSEMFLRSIFEHHAIDAVELRSY